ncbi:protein takeout-like [Sitodiplosis mosellana]|uniref:protein takeout-like n=1 Tax=Sitodiplosis mosellana TaxID=263140 RepID=UPI002444BD96|nr:protein takeout-like [Sitodiplosis mosellana]
MFIKIICCLVLVSCLVSINAFKFPLDIERCSAGDTDCIVRVSNTFIEAAGKSGHSGIALIPIDPLHIPSITIKQGADSPVNIELQFKEVDLIGLSDCRFSRITGFQKDPNGKYSLACKGPALYLVGPYKISGRVLVLPIQGVGKSNITLVEPEITMTFDGKGIKRGNNEHLAIENAKLTFKVNRLIFDFQNLYNGDKVLGESTNRFLNENWSDIFKEIKANIFDAFTLIAENTLRNVFTKVPYSDLFAN